MGYYDKDGNPTICYRDSVSRVDKRRQNRTITSDTSGRIDRDSYDIKRFLNYLKESISSESSSSGSCMSSSSKDTVNTYKTKWLIFSSLVVLALMLPIISYHVDVNSIERPTSYDLEKLNYQLTDANFWTNFALESDGAKVDKKRSSSTYERIAGEKLLGIQLFSKVVPAAVIGGQHPPIPGNCWSFPGSHGNLFIELSHTITVSHVTLDHVLKSVSPIDTIPSAPRHFTVYGLQSLDDKAVHLGKFMYDLEGNPTQTFAVKYRPPVIVDKRRQNRTITSDTSDRIDRDSYDIKRFLSYLKESISSESSSSGSCMSSSSKDTVNTYKTKWLIFSSLVVLALRAKVDKKRSSSTYERIAGEKLLGIELFSKVVPAAVIGGQHPPIPGNCWSFPGSHGNLFIELSHTITVSNVTLDHVLKSVSPNDTIPSAPRHFTVYGLQSLDDKAVHLGKFMYDLEGNPTQTFAVKVHDSIRLKYIDLQIETNYGHADYTCLYGFRVHGRI
ncbi:SUN domain-containing protein 2 [Takifugu flavidus]|uniref:SUN domain-containing protein 2 n=1 Tax=Takifugu flavidus TaxID=433684 RepID=A0A5C6NU19_9TELE|nr:SUN domain-containing protein 2 [Takifugu flavidus]